MGAQNIIPRGSYLPAKQATCFVPKRLLSLLFSYLLRLGLFFVQFIDLLPTVSPAGSSITIAFSSSARSSGQRPFRRPLASISHGSDYSSEALAADRVGLYD